MRILRLSPVLIALLAAACGPPPPPEQPTAEVPATTAAPATTATAEDPDASNGVEITETPKPKTPKPAASPGASGKPAVASIPGTSIRFVGGDGKTRDSAIVIKGAKGEVDGVASEYQFLSLVHGAKGKDWKLLGQALLDHHGHQMDEMRVVLADGTSLVYYFDISDFFGKF